MKSISVDESSERPPIPTSTTGKFVLVVKFYAKALAILTLDDVDIIIVTMAVENK